MPLAVLTLLKLVLLALLYLFVARALKVVMTDLYGPSRKRAPKRQAVATATAPTKQRKVPRELVVHEPDLGPRVVALSGRKVMFGRAGESDVLLQDAFVSDEHAEFMLTNGAWHVRDLGSTNGTYLNGAKVTQLTPVNAGDGVRVGKTTIEVRR